MSRRNQAIRSINAANNRLGGARTTRIKRVADCNAFLEWCFKNQMPMNSLKDTSFEQVLAYFSALGLSPKPGLNEPQNIPTRTQTSDPETARAINEKVRQAIQKNQKKFRPRPIKVLQVSTMHNTLGAIRRAMKALKGDPDAAGITARNLGLPPKSRVGTKLPITDQLFHEAIDEANTTQQVGLALGLKIERYLGHRGQEALMSTTKLKEYALEARQLIEGTLRPVEVCDGTKGGRPRQTVVISKYARETLQLIVDVMEYMKTHTYLIQGKSKGLKSAMQKYHVLVRRLGLVGQYSPHSLRYRYACDKLEELRDANVPRREALALCSAWLGHGSTRDRFVTMIYGRTVESSLPKTRRKKDFSTAHAEMKALVEQLFP